VARGNTDNVGSAALTVITLVGMAGLISLAGALFLRAAEPGMPQWIATAVPLVLLYGGALVIGWRLHE